MLEILRKIYDDGGSLVRASHALFEGDPRFITAIELRFEWSSVVFRALPDDDTLTASLYPCEPEPSETLIEMTNSASWVACEGLSLYGGWQLTNQQGYADGVRLEFSQPELHSKSIIELVVVASAIKLFVVSSSIAA